MKNTFIFIKAYFFNVWTLSIVLTFATINHVGSVVRSGLDPSYKLAFNYFFEHNIQIGTDVLFTLGPLGFIYAPMPLGNNILISTITVLLLKFIFISSSLYLYMHVREKLSIYNWLILIPITYLISSGIGIHHVILLIPLILILLYTITQNMKLLYLAVLVGVLGLLIKSSTGITILLIFISFSLYSLWKKEYKVPLILLLGTIIVFIFSWYLLYHNIDGIYEYFYATLEFSKGNSSIMTINPTNNWIVFLGFLVLFLSYPFLQKDKLIYLVYFITLLTTAAIFKFSMSREDHIFEFENYLFDFFFIIFLASKNFNFKALLHIFLSYMSFLLFIYYTPWQRGIKPRLERTHIPKKPFKDIDALNISKLNTTLTKISKNNVKHKVLETDTLKKIAHSSIDFYPMDVSYVYANTLNWTPRPIFQSYITYTPYLDKKNADFFKSEKAPQFILWVLDTGLNEIDQRYLLNSSPLTIYEIFNHYSIEQQTSKYSLFKKHKNNNLTKKISKPHTYTWDEWIPVPFIEERGYISSIFRAKTVITRPLVQKLKKLIYKEFEVYIEYKLYNNSIQRHRIAIDNAKNGLWVNPYIRKLFKYHEGEKVESIRFVHNKYDYFEEEIKVIWEEIKVDTSFLTLEQSPQSTISDIKITIQDNKPIHYFLNTFFDSKKVLEVSGWAFFENKKVDKSKKYFILESNSHTYVYNVHPILRKDVTKYFNAKDLDNSGFSVSIKKDKLSKGHYTLKVLLIDEKNEQSIVSIEKSITIK